MQGTGSELGQGYPVTDQLFIGLARVQTMLRDFNRLRKAIRVDHDIEAAEEALDMCERWFDCLSPNPSGK